MKNYNHILLGLLWGTIILFSFFIFQDYKFTAGNSGNPPNKFPEESKIFKSKDKPTLIVFFHSQCPCSRATMYELKELISRCKEKINANVVFFKSDKFNDAWVKTDLWKEANSIPTLMVYIDKEEKEIKLFHVKTSGHTLLYDKDDNLFFSGGITISRGHIGSNSGLKSIISFVKNNNDAEMKIIKGPIYGCAINK